MSQFELLREMLKKNNKKTVSEKANSILSVEEAKVLKESMENRMNKTTESDLTYKELDQLVESAMKETLKSTIKENGLSPELLESVDGFNFTNEQMVAFLEDTINPIVESAYSLNRTRLVKGDKSKSRGISLPVYEVALTLEAARMGALTMESVEDVAVKSDVDPNMQDLESLVDKSVDQTFNFGELTESEEATLKDLLDVEQYEDNEPNNADQKARHEDEVDFNDDSDVNEEPEAEEAGGQDELFDIPMENTSIISRIYSALKENMEEAEELDVEYVPKSDANIKDYEGQEAGKPEGEETFSNGGNAEDTVTEAQLEISRTLLGRIFKEYGITDQETKKAIVREAIHYIFKHGIKNLYPAISDMSKLVVEQNAYCEAANSELTSKFIIENTYPVLTELQEASIDGKSNKMLVALSKSLEMTSDGKGCDKPYKTSAGKLRNMANNKQLAEAALIKESISTILKASEIERERQAFRFRMNKFSEAAKQAVASGWVLIDENASDELKKEITVRRYISETAEMKEYFNILGEDSPIFKATLKKHDLTNDTLSSAALMTEVATVWQDIKNNYYNGQPLESKKFALDNMLNISENYFNLITAMKNTDRIETVLENFTYRLNSLNDKVEEKLKKI